MSPSTQHPRHDNSHGEYGFSVIHLNLMQVSESEGPEIAGLLKALTILEWSPLVEHLPWWAGHHLPSCNLERSSFISLEKKHISWLFLHVGPRRKSNLPQSFCPGFVFFFIMKILWILRESSPVDAESFIFLPKMSMLFQTLLKKDGFEFSPNWSFTLVEVSKSDYPNCCQKGPFNGFLDECARNRKQERREAYSFILAS